MKKFNLAKLLSLVLVFTLLMGTFAVLPASAAEAPSIEIVSNNVLYGENYNLMYAIKTANAPAGAEIVVTISDGTNTYETESRGAVDGFENVYVSKKGVAAQNIATVFTATATLKDGDTVLATDTQTYSVLEYLYTRLLVSTDKTEAQVAMYNALIDFGTKAEAVLCADRETKIGDYAFVTAKDATVNGETALTVKKGTKVTPVLDAGFTVPSGKALVWNVTPYGGATVTYTAEEVVNGIEVNGNVNIAAAVIEGAIEEIKSYEYTFTTGVINYGTPVELGDVTWTVTGDSTYIGTNLDGSRGLQFGKSAEPHTALTFTSADRFGDVTKIVINTSGASGTNAKLTVTVGGTQIGETVSLTATANEYEFISTTALSGVIVLSYTQTSEKAIYLKTMAVNPVAVEEPEPEEPETPDIPTGEEKTVSVVFADAGYANAADFTTYKMDGVITLNAAKGSGSNPPKYYDSGKAVRFYVNNTLTISAADGYTIKSIKITSVSDKYGCANVNYTNAAATSDSTATVTTLIPTDGTIDVSLLNASGEQLRIVSIEIVYQ